MSSTYNGRRGPNVSQYLRDLNAVKPQDPVPEENLNFDEDLAMFTNTQFFDFDSGQTTEFQAQPAAADGSTTPSASTPDAVTSATAGIGDLSGLDFMSSPDFNFDFAHAYASPTLAGFPDALGNLQPLQPSPTTVYAAAPQQQQSQAQASDFPQRTHSIGEKRKSDAGTGSARSLSFEDASRLAAEEDKRRRNTAASARFRIKKKQREQALEKSAKEMNEKVTVLEGRVNQLETENKWLKNLIMEKNGTKEDIAAMLKDLGNKRPDVAGKFKKPEPVKAES